LLLQFIEVENSRQRFGDVHDPGVLGTPPWDEFTISEPSSRATRVSPPQVT
jgi:hypothetical protein